MPRILLILSALLYTFCTSAQRADYFCTEADKCRMEEDYASAMELYRHCLDINPECAQAYHYLGIIYQYLHQDSLGLEMIKKSCQLDKENPWYLETLATMYLRKQNTDEATVILEQMAKIKKNNTGILFHLASIYINSGQTAKAIEVLNKIELKEGKTPQVSLQKHKLYMSKEDKDSAFMELQALCDEFPHDMNFQILMANQYQATGDMDKAIYIYNKVEEREPTNINLHLAWLAYYNETKQEDKYTFLRDSLLFDKNCGNELRIALLKSYIEDAVMDSTKTSLVTHAFDSLLARPQESADILTLKAAYQMYNKESDEKIAQTMRQMLDVEPGNEFALSHLMQYYAPRRDYKALEDICRRGVNHHPEELLYTYYLGITLTQQDKTTDAMDILRQGLLTRPENANPEVISDIFSAIGDLYYQSQKTEEAFAAYDSALVYKEDNISCLNNYAYYLSLRSEQLDKAEEMSYRTIKAEPDNITYLDTYAWILFMKEDYTGARIYMNRVADPEKAEIDILSQPMLMGNILEHAGDIHYMCGDKDTALRFWHMAAEKKDSTCTAALKNKIKRKKYIK